MTTRKGPSATTVSLMIVGSVLAPFLFLVGSVALLFVCIMSQ